MKTIRRILYIIIIILFFGVNSTLAYRSSTNYIIHSDSINVGGIGENSANYQMEDTIGEVGTGEMASSSYRLKGGFQQMQEVVISITSPSDVNMSPDIGGVSGGTGDGSATWKVTTDSPAGYTLSIKAGASPALKCVSGGCNVGVDSFADYTVGSVPDYNWGIDNADSEFGFSPYNSADQVQKFKNDSSDCNIEAGSVSDGKCWYKFTASDETIAQSSLPNQPSGSDTVVNLKAASGSSHLQVEGTYQATITVTAIAN